MSNHITNLSELLVLQSLQAHSEHARRVFAQTHAPAQQPLAPAPALLDLSPVLSNLLIASTAEIEASSNTRDVG